MNPVHTLRAWILCTLSWWVVATPAHCGSCLPFNWCPASGTSLVAQVGVPFDESFCLGGLLHSGIYSYTIASGSIPPGLQFEDVALGSPCPPPSGPCNLEGFGRAHGVPSQPGVYSFWIQADAGPCGVHWGNFTIEVTTGCTIQVTGSPPSGVAGQSYRYDFQAGGGQPPYRFMVASGTLPTGLNLAPWGTLSGTPQQLGNFNFAVGAVDANGCWGQQLVTLSITCPTLSLGPSALPDGAAGSSYLEVLGTSGGVGPYTYRVTSGALPAGLSLTPFGVLSGRPTQVGASTFTVESQDAAGCTGTGTLDLTIRGAVDYLSGAGLGPANPNQASLHSPAGLEQTVTAYASGVYGLEAAAGDVRGDLIDDMVTGPGPGPALGPHVRAFDSMGVPLSGVSFFAYGTLRYGVDPAVGKVLADSRDEIVTGAGAGMVFGPHVRGFDVPGGVTVIKGINYFAYGTPRYGVQVSAGDLEADGSHEIVTGPGPGAVFGPTVKGWTFEGGPVQGFGPAFDAFAGARYGVRVATGQLEAGAPDRVFAGRGAGPVETTEARGFVLGGGQVAALTGLDISIPGHLYGAARECSTWIGMGSKICWWGSAPTPVPTRRCGRSPGTGARLSR